MRRKKVLWLIKGLGLGGAEKLLELALPHIDRERFEYEVAYFLPWKNALVEPLEDAGLTVHCLNQRSHYDPRPWFRLVRLLRDAKPDLLHMHLPYAAVAGRVAMKIAPVGASIYTEHNVFERYNKVMAAAHSKTYRMNDGAIFVSHAVGKSVRAWTGINGTPKSTVIHNGVDIPLIEQSMHKCSGIRKELGISPEEYVVVTVANFTPKKRHVDLLHAAKKVIARHPRTTFVLVGGGPLKQEIRQLSVDLGIDHNVIMTGMRQDAVDIVAVSDLFVLPSQFEALGISLLEAMTLEKPTLATNVGGIPEVIQNDVDGFLVPPREPEIMAKAILRVIDDPELGRRIAVKGRQRVIDHFDIRNMVGETEAFYDQILASKGL